jgi:hypothetical protein
MLLRRFLTTLVIVLFSISTISGFAVTVSNDDSGDFKCLRDGKDHLVLRKATSLVNENGGGVIRIKSSVTCVVTDSIDVYGNQVIEGEDKTATIMLHETALGSNDCEVTGEVCNNEVNIFENADWKEGNSNIVIRRLTINGQDRSNPNHRRGTDGSNGIYMRKVSNSIFSDLNN